MSPVVVGVEVGSKAARGASRILAIEAVDGDAPDVFGDADRHAAVQLANDARIRHGSVRERARVQEHLDLVTSLMQRRPEATVRGDFHERRAGIALGMIRRVAPSRSATDVNGRITGADHLRQQHREPLVRTGHTPAALGCRIHRVQEPGSAPPRRGGTVLNDEIGGHELGEVLAHSVVVELEPIGQLTHAHGRGALDDVTEDGVTGGIAERTRLLLESPL